MKRTKKTIPKHIDKQLIKPLIQEFTLLLVAYSIDNELTKGIKYSFELRNVKYELNFNIINNGRGSKNIRKTPNTKAIR